jgi:hypothetical protein
LLISKEYVNLKKRIKLIGLDAWIKEAAMIQEKYFKGKFAYGKNTE